MTPYIVDMGKAVHGKIKFKSSVSIYIHYKTKSGLSAPPCSRHFISRWRGHQCWRSSQVHRVGVCDPHEPNITENAWIRLRSALPGQLSFFITQTKETDARFNSKGPSQFSSRHPSQRSSAQRRYAFDPDEALQPSWWRIASHLYSGQHWPC